MLRLRRTQSNVLNFIEEHKNFSLNASSADPLLVSRGRQRFPLLSDSYVRAM